MLKLVLFVMFCAVISVQSKITIANEIKLLKDGDPSTLVCDEPTAKWKYQELILAHCEKCPSTNCNVHKDHENRITASCNETHSILDIHSTYVEDDLIKIRCPSTEKEYVQLHVGRYDNHLYSENNSTFALSNQNFTLVCNTEYTGNVSWYNGNGELLSAFDDDCNNTETNYDTRRFNVTCDKRKRKSKLHIKNISTKDDGKIFGCHRKYKNLTLFELTVNVPITSVSIRPQREPLIEDKDGIFVCEVGESKPEPSFEWIVIHKDGSAVKIPQNYTTITGTHKGKLWHKKSILMLRLKRVYQQIICRATIENLPWTESEPQLLDIRYSPEISLRSHVTNLHYKAKISCETDANPGDVHYEMIQKWGETERKVFPTNYVNFKCLSFNDMGLWICRASNGIPKDGYYNEESIEIKLNALAQFSGKRNETATVGSVKHLKTCYYCYPEATDVKWFKDDEEISSDRISHVPAEDGQFPFTGTCSILKVDATEKGVQVYFLEVTNLLGKGYHKWTLNVADVADVPDDADKKDYTSSTIYIIVVCVIVIFLIIAILGGIYYVKFIKPSRKMGYDVTGNNEKSSEGEGENSDGEVAKGENIYEVPAGPGQGLTNKSYNDSADDIRGSPGPENGTPNQYIEMMGQPPIQDVGSGVQIYI